MNTVFQTCQYLLHLCQLECFVITNPNSIHSKVSLPLLIYMNIFQHCIILSTADMDNVNHLKVFYATTPIKLFARWSHISFGVVKVFQLNGEIVTCTWYLVKKYGVLMPVTCNIDSLSHMARPYMARTNGDPHDIK